MIKSTYCSLEQSKLLKEKGFKELSEYNQWILAKDKGDDSKKFICHSNDLNDYIGIDEERQYNVYHCLAIPEQWMVVEWLRVNHGIWIYTKKGYDWEWYIESIEHESALITSDGLENTPQEALSTAIDYVLTNLI